MLIQFLALPVLLAGQVNLYVISFLPAITIATYLAMGPGAYIMIIQSMYHKSWKSKAKILPALLVYNAGMSVNNTVAVFDAVLGKKNEFLRTPKYGVLKKKDDWKDNAYNLPFSQEDLTNLLNFEIVTIKFEKLNRQKIMVIKQVRHSLGLSFTDLYSSYSARYSCELTALFMRQLTM